MKLYSENENYKLYQGNMLDMLEVIEPNTIDSVVCDPPYELNFMSKGWDNAGVSFQPNTWKKCYEVLKPGGYLLAFGGSRTFHRIACAIEDAGFEIRDTIMWLYGSGFPKSMDISKQIDKRNGRTNNEFIELGKYLKEKIIDSDSICAERMGFSPSLVRFWKLGERIPNKETWLKLKDIYNLDNTYDWLIEREEAKREVIGTKKVMGKDTNDIYGKYKGGEIDITIPSTDLAKQWQGWGTALKPSYESIIIAQKPYSIEIYLLIGILDILNEVIEKCQLNLNANIVEKISKLNQAKQSVEENIVLNNVESKMFTKEDLSEVMDMLQSILTENTNLNTELLCLNFLVEICNQMSKYTTETKINLITELKILKLLVVQNILENTTDTKQMKKTGTKQNALIVEEFLKEEKLKLNYMNILSVQENAMLKEKENNLHPNLNEIIVARKPFKGSLVDNVIEYGVGGINIDECRIGNGTGNAKPKYEPNNKNNVYGKGLGGGDYENTNGRFPANTILTYDETDFDEVCGGFPYTKGSKPHARGGTNFGIGIESDNRKNNMLSGFNDSGSASRYFMNCKYAGKDEEFRRYIYTPKASKKDRDEGLDEFEEKKKVFNGKSNTSSEDMKDVEKRFTTIVKNTHPTVKPTELMQYLVRLVTPNNGIVLDPFNGSGSTGKAVMYENKERNKNYKYIGIELTEEYLPIAKARIEYVCNLPKEDKQMSIFDMVEDHE